MRRLRRQEQEKRGLKFCSSESLINSQPHFLVLLFLHPSGSQGKLGSWGLIDKTGFFCGGSGGMLACGWTLPCAFIPLCVACMDGGVVLCTITTVSRYRGTLTLEVGVHELVRINVQKQCPPSLRWLIKCRVLTAWKCAGFKGLGIAWCFFFLPSTCWTGALAFASYSKSITGSH